MKKIILFLIVFICVGAIHELSLHLTFAQEVSLVIKETDRLLILSPHPDDEILGCAGVIQQAKSTGAALKIICLTNGDHNQLSFLFNRRQLILTKRGFIRIGQTRMQESKQALASLGVDKESIIFLGYPDLGLESILVKHWSRDVPYWGRFSRISQVPYAENFSPGQVYCGENILQDLKKIIRDFKPNKIFVSHPADSNSDHFAVYVFLQLALWDLAESIDQPQILPYLVHHRGWLKPWGYHPNLPMNVPNESALGRISWQKLILAKEEVEVKFKAIKQYRSQCAYAAKFLFSFARKSELFGDYPTITVQKSARQDNQQAAGIICSNDGQSLFFSLNLRRKIDQAFRLKLFILSYSREKEFSQLPKLELTLDKNGIKITDKKKRLPVKIVEVTWQNKKTLVVKIPLLSLAHPDYLLIKTSANSGNMLPAGLQAWRILEL